MTNRRHRFRRYKNLQHQPRHQTGHPHLENNPYREGHPRSCGECPWMSCLRVDYPYSYGGIYARHRDIDKKLSRAAILSSFGYDNTNPSYSYLEMGMLYVMLRTDYERFTGHACDPIVPGSVMVTASGGFDGDVIELLEHNIRFRTAWIFRRIFRTGIFG